MLHDIVSGGRYMKKHEEPIEAPSETPLIKEMRLLHLDMVEESYWKRCLAQKLAHECQAKALKIGKRKYIDKVRAEEAEKKAAKEREEREKEL